MLTILLLKKNELINYINTHFTSFILIGIFVINSIVFWPGMMSPDSHTQYHAAITGDFGDHHPPMMSLVWRFFSKLIPGSGLMMLFHLIMLYSSALLLVASVNGLKKWLYVALPLIPPLSFYSCMIWKDVSFAFSYLLALSLLSYVITKKKSPTLLITGIVVSLLFYGTGVKFQALYSMPIPLFGLAYCHTNFIIDYKTIFYTIFSYILLITGINALNNFFVPQEKKSYSWQFVKLYDLAAISIYANKELFPSFTKRKDNYSFEKVKQKFNHERVDDLVGFVDSPLTTGQNRAARDELLSCWKKSVLQYPHYYCWHRFCNWWRMVNAIPIVRLDTLNFTSYQSLQWFCKIQQLANTSTTHERFDTILMIILCKFIFACFALLRYALRISLLLPLLLCYFFLGIAGYRKEHPASMPLILMNGVGIVMLLILFFFSMASTIRYMYIVICMVHASHSFAWWCLQDWFNNKDRRTLFIFF